MAKHTHYHVVVLFYEKIDVQGNLQNSTSIDVRSNKSDINEAVSECIGKAKSLAGSNFLDSEQTDRKNFFVKSVIEHDHELGETEE